MLLFCLGWRWRFSGAVMYCLSLLHNFIKLGLNSGSAQVPNPARGGLEIRDGENLWQWSQLEIRLNTFRRSAIPQKQFMIIIIIIIIITLLVATCIFWKCYRNRFIGLLVKQLLPLWNYRNEVFFKGITLVDFQMN